MTGSHFLFLLTYLLSVIVASVYCQYDHNLEQVSVDDYGNYGGYDTAGYGSRTEVDERPKINLGIRLKIPAIKFELPRFNMPKITVSAKIRQPDRPRVISLPEINLDTHSSSATGPASRSYAKSTASYGGTNHKPDVIQQQQEQTLTFSTQTETKLKQEEDEPQQKDYRNSGYLTQKYPKYNQMRQNSYNLPQQPVISQHSVPAYASSHQYNKISSGLLSSDLGFEAPIYVKPKDSGQPIEAYGRRPIRVMSYSGSDNSPNNNFLNAQEVFVDTRSLRNGYFV